VKTIHCVDILSVAALSLTGCSPAVPVSVYTDMVKLQEKIMRKITIQKINLNFVHLNKITQR
jgi:uncharacterized protein YcfL